MITKSYLRNKSAKTIFKEIKNLHKLHVQNYHVRIQILTINHKVLEELSIHKFLKFKHKIISKPCEGINDKTIKFFKN